MTLGNDPQPLTRRQARELAERQAQSSNEHRGRHPAGSSAASVASSADSEASANASRATTDAESSAPQSAKAARRARTAELAAAAHKPAEHKTAAPKTAASKTAAPKTAAKKFAEQPRVPVEAKSAAEPALPSAESNAVRSGVEAPAVASAPERTWTRREMRARDAAAQPAGDDPAVSEPVSASPSTPKPTAAPRPPASARPSAVRPSPASSPVPVSIDDSVPIPPVPASHGRGSAPREDRATPAHFDANDLPGLHPPVGHWSVDRDDKDLPLDGQLEPFDQLSGRGFGAGGIPTTTNALILPSVPNQGSTSGPLADSGEILITGSFDLPRSLGSTGQLPNHFDSSEMDHMLDQFDDDGAPGAAAPVSASRAVSTHASTRNVLAAPKRRMPSLPAVLAIAAAVLALGVLALFVGGYLLNIF